jgi:hypothetical protein
MRLVTSFYGAVLALAIIVCAFLPFFSLALAREGLKRVAISVVLFVAAGMLQPDQSGGLLIGSVRLALSFALFLSSLVYLFEPSILRQLVRHFGLTFGVIVIAGLGLEVVRSSPSGDLILVLLGVVVSGGLLVNWVRKRP